MHTVHRHANNPIETDHGRLNARLRPKRGLKRHRSARVLAAGHAFVQNLRRGHYDIAPDLPGTCRPRIAFDDLARTIGGSGHDALALAYAEKPQRNSASCGDGSASGSGDREPRSSRTADTAWAATPVR
jgi:hypothetical protein